MWSVTYTTAVTVQVEADSEDEAIHIGISDIGCDLTWDVVVVHALEWGGERE